MRRSEDMGRSYNINIGRNEDISEVIEGLIESF